MISKVLYPNSLYFRKQRKKTAIVGDFWMIDRCLKTHPPTLFYQLPSKHLKDAFYAKINAKKKDKSTGTKL